MRALALVSLSVLSLTAAEPALPSKAEVERLIQEGQAWLLSQPQADGALVPGKQFTLGITQLAVRAALTAPLAVKTTDPVIRQALSFQAKYVQQDGSVQEEGLGVASYTTALALQVWVLSKSGTPEQVKAAQEYLLGIQNADEKDANFGGIGYGSRKQGSEDLSNTSMALAALRMSGVPASDPRLQRIVTFLQNCQDLSSHNKNAWVKDNSGGAVYSPDESKVEGTWTEEQKPGEAKPTKLSAYGSMTYALISSYLVLELKPGDPRLDAALSWAKANYRFDANPGMVAGKERQGLFYYFGAAAKTYDLLDAGAFALADGKRVDWRADLFAAITREAEQNGKVVDLPNGAKGRYWQNSEQRWAEAIPHLTTAYVVEALKRLHASL